MCKDGNPTIDEVEEVGYIAPFVESVKQFLSIKDVQDAVLESFEELEASITSPENEKIRDIWDGSFVQTNPLFIENRGKILGF